jgi:hypothetical protein
MNIREEIMKKTLKKSIICVLILLSSFFTLFHIQSSSIFAKEVLGTKIVPLSEIMRPRFISVDKNRIYIFEDDFSISIYSADDFRFQKKFGKRGQAPGEFGFIPFLKVCEDFLIVNDLRKLMYFTLDGDFKKQIQIPFNFYYANNHLFVPLDEYFIGFPPELTQDSRRVRYGRIFNQEFQLIKQFYDEVPNTFPPPPPPPPPSSGKKVNIEVFSDYTYSAVEEGKIFVADSRKGFHISVFDKNGNLLYEIHKDYGKLKVSKKFKDAFAKERMDRPFNYKFNKYFPAFFGFKIDNQKIYMLTFATKSNKYEVVVMNLKGDVIKRSFAFPFLPYIPNSLYNDRYDIYENHLYYLRYNDQNDVYELHITEIE